MNSKAGIILFLLFFIGVGSAKAITLKAAYDARHDQVKINWTKSDNSIRQFILQRSSNDLSWVNMAYQEVTDFASKQVFQFMDSKPLKGKNYYRLQIVYTNGRTELSASELINAEAVNFDFSIYPVPVGDELTLQYKGTATLKGVLNVLIQKIDGTIVTRMRFASTTTVMKIPTTNILRGVYDIRVIVEDEIVWGRQFVK